MTDIDKNIPTEQPVKSMIDQAREAADRIKFENDRHEELVKRQEDAAARAMLGGGTGGHMQQPEISEAQKKKEGAKEFFKDTALEKAIEKYNG